MNVQEQEVDRGQRRTKHETGDKLKETGQLIEDEKRRTGKRPAEFFYNSR
jgi:hypothetical protein